MLIARFSFIVLLVFSAHASSASNKPDQQDAQDAVARSFSNSIDTNPKANTTGDPNSNTPGNMQITNPNRPGQTLQGTPADPNSSLRSNKRN